MTQARFRVEQCDPIMLRTMRIIKGRSRFDDCFLPNHEELKAVLENLRRMGCSIALTAGVWDLLHVGHVRYIELGRQEAEKRTKGEQVIMVVGADTDELTRRRKSKGPMRPIVPELERCQILSHLKEVDVVTLQYEIDQLYAVVRPDFLIVSSTTEDLPPETHDKLKQFCGEFVVLPRQAEDSTTNRIRRLAIEGADELAARIRTTIEDYFKGPDA